MARYDVYELRGNPGFLLDVQANFLDYLQTRAVIPLQILGKAPLSAGKLNPRFFVDDHTVVMATQFIGTVPRRTLSNPVAHLGHHADDIQNALDFLLIGF